MIYTAPGNHSSLLLADSLQEPLIKPMFRVIAIGAVLLIVSMLLLACTGKRPTNLGVSDSSLAPCPSSPNCVSSDAHDSNHKVPPFRLDADPGEAWNVAMELVLELPRVQRV